MTSMKLISRVSCGSRLLPQAVVVRPAVFDFSSSYHSWKCLYSARTMATKAVTIENMNPNILKLEYAVRGPLVIRAAEIEKEIEKGAQKPFKRVIKANIGDAHAMGQKPITFIRQVLSCVVKPSLMDTVDFPDDVKQRARDILGACGGYSVGSYTFSQGIDLIRQHVAEYIERRDGYPARWQDVCLSSGASTAIKNCLQLFCNNLNGKPSDIATCQAGVDDDDGEILVTFLSSVRNNAKKFKLEAQDVSHVEFEQIIYILSMP